MEPQKWTEEDEQHWKANQEWYSRRLVFCTTFCGNVSLWLREMRGDRDPQKLEEYTSTLSRLLDDVHDEDYVQALSLWDRIEILSVDAVEREYLDVCDNWHDQTYPDGPTIDVKEKRNPIDWGQKQVDLIALLQADPQVVGKPDKAIAEKLGLHRTTLFGPKAGTCARKLQETLRNFRALQTRTPPGCE